MPGTLPIDPQTAGRPQLVGTTLGDRYKLVATLGSGSMGDVYLAHHVVLGKKLAVKVLKQHLCKNEEAVQRFQQEAIAASTIGQENIVGVHDFGRTPDGSLYFVMEALDGKNLRALADQHGGALGLDRALPILLQVCRALGAAHARGIVHRDLKVDNVMVVPREDGSDLVKVLDFGISKVQAHDDSEETRRITQAGMVLGTPDYMSPEQIRGEPVDHRADVYAFGVLAYEVATGTVPFEAPNITGVMMKHLSDAPLPPSQCRPDLGLPPALDALVLRALEKEPARRFQDMAEVKEALARVFEAIGAGPMLTPPSRPPTSMPLRATPQPLPRVLDGFADTQRTPSTPTGPFAPPAAAPSWRTGLVVAAAAAVVLLGAGGVLSALREPAVKAVPPAPPVVQPPVAPLPPPTPPPAVVAPPLPQDPPPTVSPRPVVVRPPPALPEKLDGRDVGRVFGQAQARLRKCLLDRRALLPAASGRLEVTFTVLASGAVSAATLETPLDPAIGGCVVARVRELRFPQTKTPSVTFTIPMDYAFKD